MPVLRQPLVQGGGRYVRPALRHVRGDQGGRGGGPPPPPAPPGATRAEPVSPPENPPPPPNGGWIRANPIPKGYPSWNSFLQLHTQSQEQLRDLLLELGGVGEGPAATEDERKVAAYYRAAMDEDAIEEAGLGPMGPLLALCDEAASASPGERAALLGRIMAGYGVSAFFGFGAGPDKTDSERSICQIYQGGLGLPDRDYYFDEDKEEKRAEYRAHVARMLALLSGGGGGEGIPGPAVEAAAAAVYGLELRLAGAHMTKTENRDPEATYNKMTLADLTERVGGGRLDFGAYLAAATGRAPGDLGEVNVCNVSAMGRVAEVVADADADVLRHYLRWHSVRSCAKYLGRSYVDQDFRFYEKVLAGTDEIKPRWKRAMAFTESALGEALGQIYCSKYFDERSKDKALQIVESVRQALEDRLKEVDWMTSDVTRRAALDKMSRFRVKIGYPDEWIDYTSLVLEEGEPLLSMVFRSRAFDLGREVAEMNAPTDREKWFMTPQTVNAYYHPSLNEIVFPAAILQPPFFHPDADDAVNYGAMGAVVGHEMTHGFDDQGRKYDARGNMVEWWTEEDAAEYERRVEVMVRQADRYEVHGQAVRGKLTCGENIADLGGLRLAYRALRSRPGFAGGSTIGGWSQTQRFFLAWAQCWRQNITKERALQLITLDPHGPNEMRCNGPLSNLPEFHDAFGAGEGTPMHKQVEDRVDIW